MTKIQPDPAFAYMRPDEVAECWNGIYHVEGLYEALWDCVDSYKGPNPEESEEPIIGLNNVVEYWDRFTPEQQQALNDAADKN